MFGWENEMRIRELIFCLLLIAGQAAAQITGTVVTADGKPVADVILLLQLRGALAGAAKTDPRGAFSITTPPAGNYTIEAWKAAYEPSKGEVNVVAGGGSYPVVLVMGPSRETGGGVWVALALAVFYLITVIWVRALKIALPGRRLLVARVADLRDRLEFCLTQTGHVPPIVTARLSQLLEAGLIPKSEADELIRIVDKAHQKPLAAGGEEPAGKLRNVPRRWPLPWRWTEAIFWSLGLENAAYKTVHFCELSLLEYLDDYTVLARLATARDRIAKIEDPVAGALSRRIADILTPGTDALDMKKAKALLVEAEYYLYDNGDAEFSEFTGWLNKAVWLSVVGLAFAIVLAVAAGHYILLVVGAAGGFLSRLNQQLRRAKVPTDYGASWSMLFLSPVLGALSGWMGVLLIQLATNGKIQLLGDAFSIVSWDAPSSPPTLAAAFLLGFSERLFDSIVKKLEDSIDQKSEDAKKALPVNPPGPAAPDPPPGASFTPAQGKPGDTLSFTVERIPASAITALTLIAGDRKTEIKPPLSVQGKVVQFKVPDDHPAATYSVWLSTSQSGTPQIQIKQPLVIEPKA